MKSDLTFDVLVLSILSAFQSVPKNNEVQCPALVLTILYMDVPNFHATTECIVNRIW